MIEKHYAPEQPDDLLRRERGLRTAAGQQTEDDWSQLIAMLELAERWQELIGAFTFENADSDAPPDTARRPGTAGGPEVGLSCGRLPLPPDQRLCPQKATPNVTASHT